MAKKILVVDDSATVRQQVGLVLQQEGLDIEEAVDGVDAIKKISKESFDCVVADVSMPNMNGIEMIGAIKSRPESSSLPILILSTEGAKEMIAQAKKAGASGWIVKPFKADLLVKAVCQLANATGHQ